MRPSLLKAQPSFWNILPCFWKTQLSLWEFKRKLKAHLRVWKARPSVWKAQSRVYVITRPILSQSASVGFSHYDWLNSNTRCISQVKLQILIMTHILFYLQQFFFNITVRNIIKMSNLSLITTQHLFFYFYFFWSLTKKSSSD